MKQNCNHKLIFFFFKNTSFFITNLPKKIKKSIWATTPCYMPNFWRVKMGWTKDTDRFKVFLIYISQFIKYNLFLSLIIIRYLIKKIWRDFTRAYEKKEQRIYTQKNAADEREKAIYR